MFRLIMRSLRKKDVALLVLMIAMIVVQVGLELKMPDYMSKITVLVQSKDGTMNEILRNGGLMLACAFGSMLAACVVKYITSVISASFLQHTSKKIFDKTESLSAHEIKRFSTSSLITRTTNDVTQVQSLISIGAQMIVRAPLTAVWAIIKIMNKSWQWSAATAVGVVILLATIITITSVVIPRFKIIQKLTDKINNVARENLIGIRVVRAFNAEKYQEHKFDRTNADLTKTQIFNQKVLSVMLPMMYIVMYCLTLAIYFIGAHLINDADYAAKVGLYGDMVVFSSYAMQVIFSFLMLAMVFMMVPRAQVSAERINEVLDSTSDIADGGATDDDKTETGTVEFKHVSFKYPDAEDYLLQDISFKAGQGETVAFIGSTGSGKSTLINLVPRFYDATDGDILVDGINVKSYNLDSLYNLIGYVPQKAVLFNDTIANNVAYGDNGKGKITKAEITAAIKVAQAEDFVEKMPKQYNSHIAQGGTNVSGGQKQRLAIARAIARKPEIFIFDDAFSALDYKTDAELRKALKEYVGKATNLIVAQRIGTIMHADKIIVLDKGKCVGIGTHTELMRHCEVYKQIALSQLTKEELNV